VLSCAGFAYRASWLENQELRALPLSKREFFGGVFVPLAFAYLFVQCAIFMASATVRIGRLALVPGMEFLSPLLFYSGTTLVHTLFSFFAYALVLVPMATRTMRCVQNGATLSSPRQLGTIALPLLVHLIMYSILFQFLISLSYHIFDLFGMQPYALTPIMSGTFDMEDVRLVLVSSGLQALNHIIVLITLYCVMLIFFWKRELPAARAELFEQEVSAPATSRTPAGTSAA
jgi:hypothetical protein